MTARRLWQNLPRPQCRTNPAAREDSHGHNLLTMNVARRALAAATLLAGVAAAGYALFGPTVHSQASVGADGTRISVQSAQSLVADGLDPLAAALIAGLTILAIAAAYLAWSANGSPRRTRLGMACAITLLLLAMFSILTVGWLFLPAALLGCLSIPLSRSTHSRAT